MSNKVVPINDDTTFETKQINRKTSIKDYFKLRFKDLLKVLATITVPAVIGIYTATNNSQQIKAAKLAADKQQHIADESLQQNLYNNFISDIYQLYKDGELNDTHSPWTFANARYRALHRQLDKVRKAHVLQFLKEQQLIGRSQCQTGCEPKEVEDIIRLSELNFDDLQLFSDIGKLSRLNFTCVAFDRVSLNSAIITNVNMNGGRFYRSNLNGAKFIGSSLVCVEFYDVQLDGTDFSDSNLEGAKFINVNLSTTKLTPEQIEQPNFINVTTINGTVFSKSMTTSAKEITRTSVMTTTLTNSKSSQILESSTMKITLTNDRHSSTMESSTMKTTLTDDRSSHTLKLSPTAED